MRAAAPAVVALTALALSACEPSEGVLPAGPEATEVAEARRGTASLATTATASSSDRMLVLFRGAPPAGLAERVLALGGTLEFAHPVGVAAVRGLDDEGAALLRRERGVLTVTDDVTYTLSDVAGSAVRSQQSTAVPAGSDPTAAAFWPAQWPLVTIGAPAAWSAGRFGSSSTTVAILDTGIDGAHPDLVGRVDVSRSISYVAADDEAATALFPGRHVTTDLHWHGTHVAATVASNAVVAAGVTRDVTLMAVRVCTYFTPTPTCATADVLRGILHATDQGADVINMSLGGGFPKSAAGGGQLTSLIQRVLNYAHQRGVTVVVAAGNEGRDMDRDGNLFSAYCDGSHALCVSATEQGDGIAFYTNYGRSSVSVAAPGGGSVGAFPGVLAACSSTSLQIPVCQTGAYALPALGTSMAAPHVAGLAALLVDEVGRSPARIRARILKGADDLGQPGRDPFYGQGRISVPGSLGH